MKKVFLAASLAVVMASCNTAKNAEEAVNPFFTEFNTPFNVPSFDKIKIEHYMPAFEEGMAQQKQEIDAIIKNRATPDFDNTIAALDNSGALLSNVSRVFFGLNSANTTPEMQKLNKEIAPVLSKHSDDINLNPELFAKVKEVYERKEVFNLNPAQTKLLEDTYKGFVRGGANLNADDQAKLRELNSEISMLQLTFEQNVMSETNAYKLVIENEADLAGLPQGVIATAASAAKNEDLEGKWLFTLHNPSVMPFLQFADNRELRKQIFEAYINRCNNGNEADNNEVIKKLVDLRLQKAKLMGHDNYANFALEERMAKKDSSVYALLDQLWPFAVKKANDEATALQAAMKKDGVNDQLQGWDWRYYNEKVMKEKFDLDENEVRPYLQLSNVRDGIFYVCNQLYGITFTEIKDIPLPHQDAMAYECKDQNGDHLGVLYMDFHPRASKRGGAWCGTYRGQSMEDGKRVAPVVTIVCNFTEPADGKPALLSADETETFFHEFGHALHNLFKNVDYKGVGGVPRDFVELPSQIMEHWAFEPSVLKVYAKHYETGEVMPDALIEKMEKSGTWGQGFATTEYLAASILDMDYHVMTEVPADFSPAKFEAKQMSDRKILSQIPPRYRSTYFRHTMGGGYTAGYYSYIWAEVLDADAFQAFVETGDIFNKEVAGKFRTYVLTPGGIDDAMDMYKNFRGSEPGIKPLLNNRGLN